MGLRSVAKARQCACMWEPISAFFPLSGRGGDAQSPSVTQLSGERRWKGKKCFRGARLSRRHLVGVI